MSVKLLTKHHLEFLSFKGGCTGSSGSTLVKIPHCWKSHAAAQIYCRVQQVMQHWSPSFQPEQEKSTNRRKKMKTLKMGLLCPSSLPIVQKRCMKLYFSTTQQIY